MFRRCWDSSCGSLVVEVTALPVSHNHCPLAEGDEGSCQPSCQTTLNVVENVLKTSNKNLAFSAAY